MDTLMKYRGIISCILTEYRDSYAQGQPEEIDTVILQDDEYGEYMLYRVGWDGKKRVHNPVFYLRLKNNKIYIEEDWTEVGVVIDLVRAGVPQYDIVLAFNPPFARHLTGYAVA